MEFNAGQSSRAAHVSDIRHVEGRPSSSTLLLSSFEPMFTVLWREREKNVHLDQPFSVFYEQRTGKTAVGFLQTGSLFASHWTVEILVYKFNYHYSV
jgi:hypothetical protein